MPVATINLGDSEATVKTKILDILTYHGISTSGITSWGLARSRLNNAATLLVLPGLGDGMKGDVFRARTNALALSQAAADPVNTVLPAITGTAAFGQTLNVSNGTWSGFPVPTYTYQWKRNGADIVGATNNAYTLVTADIGQVITASVTATNTGGSATATSTGTVNVVAPPVNTVLPAISGVAAVGQVLTTSNGTWTGYPVPTYTYQWKEDGVNIVGATNNNFTLTSAQLGKVVTVSVTATNSQGNATATSNGTVAIVSVPVNTAIPVISGAAVSGQTLSTTNGTWSAYPAPTYTYQWKADGVNIGGATANTFLLTDTQAGTNITVTVTATNSQGSTASTSNMTAIVKPSWMTQDLNLFADFVNDRYWKDDVVTNSIISDVHPQDILVLDATGTYINKTSNVLSRTTTGLQVVPTRTNGIRNNSFAGAAVGSPGTLPNNWAMSGNTGLSRQILAIGTENGLPYMDIRWFGTAGSAGPLRLDMDTASAIPASVGQTWTLSLFEKVLAEPAPATSYNMRIMTYDAGLVNLNTLNSVAVPPDGSMQRYEYTFTLGDAATASIRPSVRWGITSGVAYDFTARLYAPQLELGAFATPPIITTSAAITRTGNITTTTLPAAAQAGIAGYVKLDQIGFNPADLPVILGLNPSSKVAQSLMDAAFDLGTIAPATRTIVFAASPGYTKVRILGGADTTAIAGDFDDDIVSASIGGNGFDALNNLYGMYKILALKYGVQNDTTFNTMYGMAT